MPKRYYLPAIVLVALAASLTAFAQSRGAQANAQPPDIVGKWSGSWSSYNPAQAATPPREQCAKLDAVVTQEGGVWKATFEGDCGRPYRYAISMEGRAAGRSVMFKGSADLGPQDGGVYDWIGRATATEFIGFYTSGFSTGTFSLARVK